MKKIALLLIALLLSSSMIGCDTEPMPDVVGMPCEDAVNTLKDVNSFISIEYQDRDGKPISSVVAKMSYKDWEVVAQTPESGTEHWIDDDIVLTIADIAAEERAAAKEAEKAAEEAERQQKSEEAANEEAEKVAKWGKDYLKEDAAIAAVEQYGENQYPYGFKMHTIMGKIACEQEEDGSWFVKYTCDVTNEYGATMKDLNCEAQVAGTDSDPVVTYFQVY